MTRKMNETWVLMVIIAIMGMIILIRVRDSLPQSVLFEQSPFVAISNFADMNYTINTQLDNHQITSNYTYGISLWLGWNLRGSVCMFPLAEQNTNAEHERDW